jgi:alpha/beta superfamily hydrolase
MQDCGERWRDLLARRASQQPPRRAFLLCRRCEQQRKKLRSSLRLAKYYTNQPSILPRQARDKRKETINSIETQNAGLEWELQQKLDAKGNPQPPHFFDEHIHQIDGSVATVQRRERCGNQKDVVCAMPFSC